MNHPIQNAIFFRSGSDGYIAGLEFASDGGIVTTFGENDSTIRLWDSQTWSLRTCIDVPTEVFGVAVSLNGRYVATGSETGFTYVFNVDNGSQIAVLRGRNLPGNGVFSVAFSPDGMNIVSGSYEITIRDSWKLGKPPRRVDTLSPEGGEVRTPCYMSEICSS